MPPRRPVIERLLEKVYEDDNGCWIFTGSRTHRGYGQIGTGVGKKHGATHRIAYEYFRVEIPDGLQLDHLCRVRACCNPWHLEPVTNAVNKERSRGFVEDMHPACKAGHPWTPENTYRAPNGTRHCRVCGNARTRAYKARKRQEARA